MATVITQECINCGACEPECPNVAIYAGGVEYESGGDKHAALSADFFYIVPAKCTECVGFHDHEACAAVCPVDCCIPDPAIVEDEALLIARAKVLHPERVFADDFPSRFRNRRRESSVRLNAGGNSAIAETLRALPGAEELPQRPGILGPLPVEKVGVAEAVAGSAAQPRSEAKNATSTVEAVKAEAPASTAEAAKAEAPASTVEAVKAEAPAGTAPAPTESPIAPAPAPAPGPVPLRGGQPCLASAADLAEPFDVLLEKLRPPRRGMARLPLVGRWFGARSSGRVSGVVPHDGFTSGSHESKRERERRYGEVYEVEEWPGGLYVRMELPRRIPASQARDRLALGDEMPDYDIVLEATKDGLSVRGSVVDDRLRSLCGVSPSFPSEFLTLIPVAAAIRGLSRRYSDKVLEVVVLKEAR